MAKRIFNNDEFNIEKLEQIIECPQLYLIHYFDNIKAKVDIQFETELSQIAEITEKEKLTQKWIKIIEIIDKCLAKCLKNKLSEEVVNETKDKLEFKRKPIFLKELLLKTLNLNANELKSYLLSNDSYLVLLLPNNKKLKEQILIVESGFTQIEIQSILKYRLEYKENRDPNYNFIKMNYISQWFQQIQTLIYIESLQNKENISFNLKSWQNQFNQINGGFELNSILFKEFKNLKQLEIDSVDFKDLNVFNELHSLESLTINYSNLKSLEANSNNNLIELSLYQSNVKEFKINGLNKLKKIDLSYCMIELKENILFGLPNLEFVSIKDFISPKYRFNRVEHF